MLSTKQTQKSYLDSLNLCFQDRAMFVITLNSPNRHKTLEFLIISSQVLSLLCYHVRCVATRKIITCAHKECSYCITVRPSSGSWADL